MFEKKIALLVISVSLSITLPTAFSQPRAPHSTARSTHTAHSTPYLPFIIQPHPLASLSVVVSPSVDVPTMTSDKGKDTAVSSDSDDDFFGDIIGYSELIRQKAELESNPNFSGLFSNLQSKANECKLISTSINSLETTLAQARKETASANIQDGIEQKTSDDALEKIKTMEDRTSAIENTFIPQAKQGMQELKICIEKLTQQIAKGTGWTNEQEEMRDHLAESHEQCQKEVTKVNSQMAQLRSQVEIKEQEVQSFVKSRDDLNSRLHQLEQDIYNANEQLVASKLVCLSTVGDVSKCRH